MPLTAPTLDENGLLVDNCGSCRFYHPGECECHRHAPRPAMHYQMRKMTKDEEEDDDNFKYYSAIVWPEVKETDYCGEYEPWPEDHK